MSISGTQPTAPGWYPDPAGTRGRRWHDGKDWTGQVTLGEPTRRPRRLGHGFARLGDVLGWMLGLCSALLGVLAMIPTWFWINPAPISLPQDPTSTRVATAHLAGAAGALPLVALACGVLVLVTVATWLVWQYRLARTAPAALRRSPAAHVWWWFVPFANCWVPRHNMGDLWGVYGRQRDGEQDDPVPVVFSLWWAFVLAPLVFEPVSVLLLVRVHALDDAVASVVMGNLAVTLVAAAFAAFTARRVVMELSWRALLFWSDDR